MVAHDHIDAQITQRLGHFPLGGVGGGAVFIAPVDVQHNSIRTLCAHGRQSRTFYTHLQAWKIYLS